MKYTCVYNRVCKHIDIRCIFKCTDCVYDQPRMCIPKAEDEGCCERWPNLYCRKANGEDSSSQ